MIKTNLIIEFCCSKASIFNKFSAIKANPIILITNDAPKSCTTHMGDLGDICIGALDKGERKICKDDCVYY
jgi:hypothetical protein